MELSLPTAFSLTKQINDFGELKDRQATFTNSFDIPKTKKNIDFFHGLGIVGNQSRFPYFKISARIVINSVSVVSDGSAIVQETSDNYKVVVYDGNIHLSEALGSKTLAELDLSSLDHDLTTGDFSGSFANDYTDGYIYGIADFGNFDPAGIVINNQLPSFFVRWIWDKIFEEAGFTKDFEPDADLVITPKRGYIAEEDTGSAASISSSDFVYYYDDTGIVSQQVEAEFPIVYEPDQTVGHITLAGGKFTVAETRLHFIDIDTKWNYIEGEYINYLAIRIYKNGNLSIQDEFENTIDIEGVVISKSNQIYLQVGDEIEIKYFVRYYNAIEEDGFGNYSVVGTGFSIDSNINFYTVLNATGISVNVGTFIGEMKQYDFVKDVMQHYGLISQKVKDEKSIQFRKMKDLLRDTSNAYDYSDKIIVQSETYETDYAQNNYFNYQYKNSDSEPFARGKLALNNTTLTAEATQVTRPYNAPEPSETLLNSGLLLSVPFWEAERDNTGAITKWKIVKGKNYFARVINRSGSVSYKTANGTLQPYTGTYPVLSFQNLNYQKILEANYQEVKIMLDSARQVKAQIQMNLFEYDSFNFLKLLYSKQLGGYFYVNKLKWTNGKPLVDADLVFVPQN